jgi:exodeoxyribonuclease VII large subunit
LTINNERLSHGARTLIRRRRDYFSGLEARLKASRLSNAQAQRQTIARERERAQRLAERARRALAFTTQRLQARVAHSSQLLAALSYRSVLARGFALVRDGQGLPVHAAVQIGAGARLHLEFSDGSVMATADSDRPAPSRVSKPAVGEKAAASELSSADREPRASDSRTSTSKTSASKRPAKPADQGSLF